VSQPLAQGHAQGHPALAWFHGSFGARVVALFLGLLALVQIASFSAIKQSLREQAYRELPEALAVAERVMLAQLDAKAAQQSQRVRVYAADYGLHSVVNEDAETIGSLLEDNATGRTGADEAALLGLDFVPRASVGRHIGSIAARAQPLAATAGPEGSASEIAMLAGSLHRIVLAPVKPPNGQQLGWLLMSFRFEPSLIDDMRFLSKLHFTLLARDAAGARWDLALSSLPPERARALAADMPLDHRSPMPAVQVQGEELGLRAHALAGGAVLGVVTASIDEATRVPQQLQLWLLLTTAAAFGIFAIGSLYTAGLVTKPLRRLAQAAERLGAGDYATPVRGTERSDEIGELAQSFENMRVSVAEKQEQILRLAYWDALTGLPNRAQFRDAVIEAIASAGAGEARAPVAVLMLDLDRFKHVNDVLGYAFGDKLLQGVAERLSRQVMRDGDLVARLSGDEFAILLRAGDPALAESVARRVSQAFEQPLTLDEHKVDMGAGIGIACWPQDAGDADALINRAEVAMYAAKQRHQDALMYDPSLDAASAQTLSLLSDLRQAIEHGELRLFLQPKLALATGAVVGAEALVRWQHPTRGLVPPIQFIPFAEQTGFIRQLTIWVFEAAAQAWRELHADGTMLVLSVNLSVRDLMDQDLPPKLEALLVKHRVPAEAFCLEITESAIMDDPERALGTLNRLAAMGFKLSIDDFGSGQSSYGYLKRLPVDELKIDMAFIRNMDKDPIDAKIVRSIVELAHNLELSVVAEGVENARIWDLLRDLRCDQAQGYHMGKPMPSSEFRPWSARWVEARGVPGRTAGATLLH
jgi:diguanylate cyclase (GGDEF)-like protein